MENWTRGSAARWNTPSNWCFSKSPVRFEAILLFTIVRFCLPVWWERFSLLPPEKLSITTTRWPSVRSLSTKWLPINPAPPVTRYVFIVGLPRVELGLTGPKPVVLPSYSSPITKSSRRESNPHQDLRRVLLYPLSYERISCKMLTYWNTFCHLLIAKKSLTGPGRFGSIYRIPIFDSKPARMRTSELETCEPSQLHRHQIIINLLWSL